MSSSLNGHWKVTHLHNEMTDPGIPIDILLEEDEQRVSGSAGCNRFFGRYTIDPDDQCIQFGEMAVTRMMCSPDIMKWEEAILLAFTQITDYTLSVDELTFRQGNKILIRARKISA